MDKFLGKKILLFAPKFFNYEIEIKNKLEELGAYVDFYDERTNPDNFTKILIRIKKNIIRYRINKYYLNIYKNIKKIKYDFVLFISPETITKELIQKLKKEQENAKFILYMWDSINNKKNVKEILEEFDNYYSFDKKDCEDNDNFKFRPLFYLDEYSKFANNSNSKYDIAFIGTVHSDRYSVIKMIKEQSIENRLKINFFMYFPSKIIFLMKKIFDKSYKNTNIKDFSFKSISKKEVLNIISDSKIILDIQHPSQIGLTMRTIEILGMKKKIITTNNNIRNYDFYNPNNVYIIDRDQGKIDLEFLKKDYVELDKKIYDKYNIANWLEEIFFS